MKQDRLLAQMGQPTELRRGMIVLFTVGDSTYIKRVAALPGDRIGLIQGEVYLNGRRVPTRLAGETPSAAPDLPGMARRFVEKMPGEAGSHEILDHGYTAADDFPLRQVPDGHVFVLGDNRDMSADSRFPRDQMGADLVPISDIMGVASYIYWRVEGGFGNWPLG